MSNPPWATYQNDTNRRRYTPNRFNTDKQVPNSLPAITNIAYHHGGSRAHDLESRIKVSEQSNRVLLEELMKLQEDMKIALRKNEEMVMKERQERLAIRDKVEAAEIMYNRVSMQLIRTEEKVNMEHMTLASLLNQSKEVERALAGGQQRSAIVGEQIDRYIARFRDELSELRQANEQIHSSLRLVGEDVRNLQHRFEMQASEFESSNQEMRQKVKRIETESMTAMDTMQRNKVNNLEGSTSQLKQSMESRLSEIRDAVNEVRRKTDMEASERRAADQQVDLRVEKVQTAVRELEMKCQEVTHTASLNMREKDSVREVEKSKLAYKMAELTEETNKKALQREMQLSEEAQMKFSALEKRFHEEQTCRLAFEKSIRNEMEKILESLKMHFADELQTMRKNSKLAKVHEDESLAKINECVALLESEIEAGKKAFEEVLHAEIIARQNENEKTLDKCNELHERLAVAVSTLQQAISGVASHAQEAVEQVKGEILAVLDENTKSGVNGLADVENRITNLNKHVAELEKSMESRTPPPSPPPTIVQEVPTTSNVEDYERLNKRVDRTYKWQEGTEKTLRELSTKVHPIHGEISKLRVAIEDLEYEMEASRMARLASLGGEETSTKPAPPETSTPEPADTNVSRDVELEKRVQETQEDMQQVSNQMGKLEQSVNTLRTVLSQKISSEAETVGKMRETFSNDIEKIVNYFLREQRHVFVKHRMTDAKVYRPDLSKDGDGQAHSIHLALLSINRWGVYEAYKMLELKRAWFRVVENKTETPELLDEKEDSDDEDSEKVEAQDEKSDVEEENSDEESSEGEKESEESEVEDSDDDDEEESEENDSDDEEDEKDSGSETEGNSKEEVGRAKSKAKSENGSKNGDSPSNKK